MIYQYSAGQFFRQPPQGRVSQASSSSTPGVPSFLPPPVAHAAAVSSAEKPNVATPALATVQGASNAPGIASCMVGANSQTVVPPACIPQSGFGSPHVQIRASRAQHTMPKKSGEGFVLRAVATPARGEEWRPWAMECTAWLANEGEETRYRGRARFLDQQLVTSVQDAVDGLNRRIIWCPEDFCVVCSAADRAYFLVYRKGRLDSCLAQLGVTREEVARGSAAKASSSQESEGRKSVAEAVQIIEQTNRPGIAETPGAPKSYKPIVATPVSSTPAQPIIVASSQCHRQSCRESPAPPLIVGRPLGHGPGRSAHGEAGAEPRHSEPLLRQQPVPTRRGHSIGTVAPKSDDCQVPSSVEELPLQNDENEWPATFRELSEVEKVNYSDLVFVESLGSGEFGQVFRGFFRNEEVAIKQLYWDDTLQTDIVLQDLAKEIESFRHLRHKRLVRFIGACLEMPHPCLVTQYMPGGSLHHLLHVRKLQLPDLHAMNICLQLADGVMYLHLQTPTVVHRDLKSLNVVLDLNLNIKICDFGLTESMERTHITKGNNGGSPRYMAPELFDSKTKITEKIDVWAMGCIFIEIFGGPVPYDQINTLADLTREMLVYRRAPDVPEYMFEEIRTVMHRCLEFDHRLRISSKHTFKQLQAAKKQLRDSGQL